MGLDGNYLHSNSHAMPDSVFIDAQAGKKFTGAVNPPKKYREMASAREPVALPRTTDSPHLSAGMNVLNFPEGQYPKATDLSAGAQAGVSPWYGAQRPTTLDNKEKVSIEIVLEKFFFGRSP